MYLRPKPDRRSFLSPLLWAALLPALAPQHASAQLTPQMVEAKKRQKAEEKLKEKEAEVTRLQAELEQLKQQKKQKQPEGGAATAEKKKVPEKTGQQQTLDPRVRFRTMEAVMQQPDCELCGQMATLPEGSFVIGSPRTERGRDNDEDSPPQSIIIRAFELGRSEVTQAQWRAVMGVNPSRNNRCDACPAEGVSWYEITGPDGFLVRLNKITGQSYRLPSEAEWEYATRAGTRDAYWWGPAFDARRANNGSRTVPPAPGLINAFGLANTAGNVWEWTADCYADKYTQLPVDGGAFEGPGTCSHRVVRGGSWGVIPDFLRSAERFKFAPDFRYRYLGFRVARTP